MSDPDFDQLIEKQLCRRQAGCLLRQRRVISCLGPVEVEVEGRTCVNFASNNYLGLTHHPSLIEAVRRAACAGSGASALVSGYSPAHQAAEAALAKWKSTQSAVLLPSGYQAAHAAIQTLAGVAPGRVRLLLDKLCHASLIDAAIASRSPLRTFPHNQFGKLKRLLAEAPTDQIQVVVTESIFSMDGDAADLQQLAALRRQYPFVLLLDEAHGSGVFGPDGAGYAAEVGLTALADVTLVTLSKAMGLGGGAVCGSRRFCEALVNFGRAYIYSTSVPPMIAQAVPVALELMAQEPERQARVRALDARVRQVLAASGLEVPAGQSPIVPVILRSEEAALAAAQKLFERGLWVPAIRPPTVPRGTSRLRIALSSEHSDEQVARLIEGVKVAISPSPPGCSSSR